MQPTIPDPILEQLRTICQAHGCHLLEARLVGLPGRQRLVLYIDNEEGITHRDCAAISDAVLAELAGDPFEAEFQFLEVSSPGVDRPLSFPWQFRKHVGRRLRCQLLDHSIVEGVLYSVTEESISVRCSGTLREIPFTEVQAAYVVPQW